MHNITIADTVGLNDGSYVILRDGPSVDVVFVKEPQDEYEIEGALTEAAVAALSGGRIGSTGKSETPLARRDPDTFAAGEYVVASETLKAVLVTEDAELRKKVRKCTNTIGYKELRRELAKIKPP
jgi:hypothetical protein